MKSKAVSGIMLTLLLTGMLTLTFAVQPVKADPGAPAITILSPLNITYPIYPPPEFPSPPLPIPLTFTVNETTSWIGYSLDGWSNMTITGNTTVVDPSWHIDWLPKGPHSVTVYANDTAGNMGSSETVHFTVTMWGDANGDGIINIVDIVMVAIHFGEDEPEDPNWNPSVDLNQDGVIDIVDIVIVAIYFGRTW